MLHRLGGEEGVFGLGAEEAFLASTARLAQPAAPIGEVRLRAAPGPRTLDAQLRAAPGPRTLDAQEAIAQAMREGEA